MWVWCYHLFNASCPFNCFSKLLQTHVVVLWLLPVCLGAQFVCRSLSLSASGGPSQPAVPCPERGASWGRRAWTPAAQPSARLAAPLPLPATATTPPDLYIMKTTLHCGLWKLLHFWAYLAIWWCCFVILADNWFNIDYIKCCAIWTQQFWYVPTQGVEGQGPKHSSDLRAGAQSSSHCFVGDLWDVNLWHKHTKDINSVTLRHVVWILANIGVKTSEIIP